MTLYALCRLNLALSGCIADFGRNSDTWKGDVKSTATYEEDPKLYGYALDLQKFDKLLRRDIEEGIVTIEEREFTNIEDKEYLI